MTPGLLARVRLALSRPPAKPARRDRRDAARTAIGVGFVAVLAATAGMTAAVESFRPEWRDPEFGHRLTRLTRVAAADRDRPLVVVVGTSRTQNAVWPAAMPSAPGSPRVFNFGQAGATPLGQLLTVLRLRDAGVRPAAVVVEILPVWMVADGAAEDVYRGKALRLTAADLRHLGPFTRNADSLRTEWLAARVAPWHAHRSVLLSHWLPRWVPWGQRIDFQWDAMDSDGFTPYPHENPSPEVRAAGLAHTRDEYAGAFKKFRTGDTSVRAVRELVNVCRAERVSVAFLVPPVSPTFRGWFDPNVWAAADAHLKALAAELGVPVFAAPGMPEADFADGHHLLRRGAEVYSRRLAAELNPWVAQTGGTR